MARVVIVIGSHLSTAPRPLKEALAFSEAGHDVTVLGVWFDPELLELDKKLCTTHNLSFIPVIDFSPNKKFQNIWTRLSYKKALLAFKYFKLVFPELYGYGAKALYRKACALRADMTIVHSEAGLWLGEKLHKEGLRVGVDFEDWFSKDLPPDARSLRPIKELEQLEHYLLNGCSYTLTTSQVLAETLATTYRSNKPLVIYNTFPLTESEAFDSEPKDRVDKNKLSLHWFSHTIGQGRGLETLFLALKDVPKPVEVHLRGAYPFHAQKHFERSLKEIAHHDIYVHPRVAPDELLSRIAEHDVGVALERSDVQSRDLTVTNKLFQYMQAKLTVIATKTQGQCEVMNDWCADEQLIPVDSANELAHSIRRYQDDALLLAEHKELCYEQIKKRYHFENQKHSLVELLKASLQ